MSELDMDNLEYVNNVIVCYVDISMFDDGEQNAEAQELLARTAKLVKETFPENQVLVLPNTTRIEVCPVK